MIDPPQIAGLVAGAIGVAVAYAQHQRKRLDELASEREAWFTRLKEVDAAHERWRSGEGIETPEERARKEARRRAEEELGPMPTFEGL